MVRAEFWNYQSHEHTVVDFTKGMNAFVGTSNAGKSSAFRGLKWNLTNQPSGDEFIRLGTTEAAVLITWSDGHAIERRRNKGGSKNTYTLYKDGELLEEYTGFGSKVPPQILAVTGIDPDLKFNFANQLESAFLLSETPKVRAERIGNLEELGKIDAEVGVLNDDIKYKKKEQKEKTAELNALEKERNDYLSSLKKDKEKVETIKVLQEALIEKDKLLNTLETVHPRLLSLQENIKRIKGELEVSTRVINAWDEELPKKVETANRLVQLSMRLIEMKEEAASIRYMSSEQLDRLVELTDIVTRISTSYQRLSQTSDQLERIAKERETSTKGFSNRVSGIDYSNLDQQVERFTALFRAQRRLADVKEEQQEVESSVSHSNNEINKLLDLFVTTLRESEVCPTCFQETAEVEKKTIQEVI